ERQARAAAARKWITTIALGEPVRRAFLDLISATELDGEATAAALRHVIEVTGPQLDPGGRSELERLARDVEAQTGARTCSTCLLEVRQNTIFWHASEPGYLAAFGGAVPRRCRRGWQSDARHGGVRVSE